MASNQLEKNTPKGVLLPLVIFVSRLVTGALYVYSGFVKVIDPWGFYYKLLEYIAALQWDWLLPYTTFLSFVVPVGEFLIGVFLLLGCYRKAAPVLALLSMLLFLPLTGWVAFTDVVADCGCFGEAFQVSNWMTFGKNIMLALLLAFLVVYNKRLKNVYGFAVQWIVFLFSGVFALIVAVIGYIYQPLIDFMPFGIGESLVKSVDINDEDIRLIYEKGGNYKEFTVDSLPDETWTFVERKLETTWQDKTSLTIFFEGEDVTLDVVKSEGNQIFYLFPDLKEVDISYTYKINEVSTLARANGIDVVGLTSASAIEVAEWVDLSMADYPIYSIDDSVLKQIARGNPAMVFVSNGLVVWKRAMQSISDEIESSQSFDVLQVGGAQEQKRILLALLGVYLGAMLVLLIINRTHKVVKFSLMLWRKPKK